jgi:flagellar biogenesis protein FliO
VKNNIFIVLLFFFFSAVSIVSAQPVASEGNGFLASEPFLPEQPGVATIPFLLPSTDPFATSLRVISALFAVIIIALILSWFIQRRGVFGGNVFGKVIGILPLDNRRVIYLVDVVGRILVLGVTETNINLLCEISDKNTIDSLRLQGETPTIPGMEKLFSFLKKTNSDSADPGPEAEAISDLGLKSATEKNHERLQKLNKLLIKRNSDKDE